MLLFSIINVMGVKWLSETNKIAVWWKIAIPVLAVVVLMVTSFHPGNFTAGGGFMPFGWKGVFSAIASGGVIFAYLGFEQAIQLGGESKNPRRNIPLAVIGSMILGRGPLHRPPGRVHGSARPGQPLQPRMGARRFSAQRQDVRPVRRPGHRPRPRLAGDPAVHRRDHLARRNRTPYRPAPARA